MLGRNVYVNTSVLIDQLERLHSKQKKNRQFAVCFLRNDDPANLPFNVALFDDQASIYWRDNETSAVTTHPDLNMKCIPTCDEAWRGIPSAKKSRAATERQFAIWKRRTSRGGFRYL
jgi:hypothetical protein